MIKIAMIQTSQNKLYNFIERSEQLSNEEAGELQDEMRGQTIQLIKEAITMDCDMIITPEAINYPGEPEKIKDSYETLVPKMDDQFFTELGELARQGNAYLVVGAFCKREVGGKYSIYNSAFIYNPQGECIDIYDKIHLAGSEQNYVTAGDEYVVFDTAFGKVGVAICWDMQFPEVARELVLRDADLIVCPTWGWEEIYGHARAYENGVYVAAAMAVPYWMDIEGLRTPSEVVSPEGQVLVRGSYTKAGVVVCEVNPLDCEKFKSLRMENRKPDTYKKHCEIL